MTIIMRNSRIRFYCIYIDMNVIKSYGENVEIFQYNELFIGNEKMKFTS